MGEQLKAFINGYSKSLTLFPDFSTNNQQSDWETIGNDIQISIKKYCHINEMEKSCQAKKRTSKIKISK